MGALGKILCMLLAAATACGPGFAGRGAVALPPGQGSDDDLSHPQAISTPGGAAQASGWQPRTPWVNSPAGAPQVGTACCESPGASGSAARRDDASLTLLRLHCQLII